MRESSSALLKKLTETSLIDVPERLLHIYPIINYEYQKQKTRREPK